MTTITRDGIIRMAREAGLDPDLWNYTDAFERFAALVAAAERKRVRSAMKKAFRRMADLIRADEREACIKAVEKSRVIEFVVYPKDYLISRNDVPRCYDFQHARSMEAIRARGQS